MAFGFTSLADYELHNCHYRRNKQCGKNDAGGDKGAGVSFLKIALAIFFALNTNCGR